MGARGRGARVCVGGLSAYTTYTTQVDRVEQLSHHQVVATLPRLVDSTARHWVMSAEEGPSTAGAEATAAPVETTTLTQSSSIPGTFRFGQALRIARSSRQVRARCATFEPGPAR